jgi:hypothetical protein
MVRFVDGGGDARAIAMLGLDGGGQIDVGGAQLRLQRGLAQREIPLKRLDPRGLGGIEVELFMQQLMHLAFHRARRGDHHMPEADPADRRHESQRRRQDQ